ncbi:MAG: M23 family metallopeptidase [Alphaproteobacteria bacterium]|nr:MAG: M23 family metallopeptidase [Alphaproteobacteria bacterium]
MAAIRKRRTAAVLALVMIGIMVPGDGGRTQDDPVKLTGAFVQGGLIQGTTVPQAKVTLDGRAVRVARDGRFVFGFGRDAAPRAVLEVVLPDGTRIHRELAVDRRTYKVQRIDGLPSRMVTPPADVLARIREENARIAAARARDRPEPLFESGFIWPVKGPISGVFGSQRILNRKPRRPHYGVDIAAPEGTPVVAPADGIVVIAARDMYYTGGTVLLDHGHGLTSVYSHLKEVRVREGQRLRQGEVLGTVGATGRVTGPHLDWRINWFDQRLDPALLVPPMTDVGR